MKIQFKLFYTKFEPGNNSLLHNHDNEELMIIGQMPVYIPHIHLTEYTLITH